jgi:hypothetical protein
MAHDRIDGDQMFLTHEFLSLMLGVRRASITDTLRILAEDDLIAIKRGTIAILDRVRLQKSSNDSGHCGAHLLYATGPTIEN